MSLPAPKLVPLSTGIEMSVHDTGGNGVPVVLGHGFPDLGRTWAVQLDALAAAGFRGIAPDQRGYGGSSRPPDIDAYGMGQLTDDLVALADALDIDQAIWAGHDWGGFVSWAMPVLHPDRCLGAVGVGTPYMAFAQTELLRLLVDGHDERLYILWFQEPGVAEGVLDTQAELLFRVAFRRGTDPSEILAQANADAVLDLNPFRRLPEIEPRGELLLDAEELAIYVETFNRTGFAGPINWYRNIDANAANLPEIGDQPLSLPCLMLCAEWDPVLPPAMADRMAPLCSDLELHVVGQAGHFLQRDSADEVSRLLVDWLSRRFR